MSEPQLSTTTLCHLLLIQTPFPTKNVRRVGNVREEEVGGGEREAGQSKEMLGLLWGKAPRP